MIWALAAFWAACGVLHYSLYWAHFSREFPEIEYSCGDAACGVLCSLAGPCALIAAIFLARHGFRWR